MPPTCLSEDLLSIQSTVLRHSPQLFCNLCEGLGPAIKRNCQSQGLVLASWHGLWLSFTAIDSKKVCCCESELSIKKWLVLQARIFTVLQLAINALTSASTGWFLSFTYRIIQAYIQAVKWYPSEIPTDNFPDFDDVQIESLPSTLNDTHLSLQQGLSPLIISGVFLLLIFFCLWWHELMLTLS